MLHMCVCVCVCVCVCFIWNMAGVRCQWIYAQYQLKSNMAWGPLINTQNSVFLPLWDNYELHGRKMLHIESFSAIESENLVRISKLFV